MNAPLNNSAYKTLEQKFARMAALEDASRMLGWDHAAMMPEGGADSRADTLSTIDVILHEFMTDPRVADLLADAGGEPLSGWQAANLHEMRRRHARATALPADLVEALSQACLKCEVVWRKARAANDFAAVKPYLEEVLNLTRQEASALGSALDLAPYDALVDGYEPGARAADIDTLFDELTARLPAMLEQVLELQGRKPAPIVPQGPFARDKQKKLGEAMMAVLGFDFAHGRLDESHHPFCGGVPDDVRITTRYYDEDFSRSLMAVLHETGHALYQMGLPRDWRRQPVGVARGMAMHESQSLLMEMQASRSPEFLSFLAPQLKDFFGGDQPAFTAENMIRLYHKVDRSLIRVDADEVTYPLHVILRYRLERAMIAGDLKIADLPGAWDDMMKKLIGIVPPEIKDGCMQDVHWNAGLFGYFPTYTMGAMTAAQLFQAATKADPSILPGIGKGDFKPLLAWVRANVHEKGSLMSTPDLLVAATGKTLSTAPFLAHLEKRYLGTGA